MRLGKKTPRGLWGTVLGTALTAAAVLSLGCLAAPVAGAATITLGSPLTAPFEFAGQCNFADGCQVTAVSLSEPGALTASPVDGTVVGWRVAGTTAGSPYSVSVLRPDGDGTFTATAASPALTSAGQPTETFAADLPIHAGEYAALSFPIGAGIDLLEPSGWTKEAYFDPLLAAGESGTALYQEALDESAFDVLVDPALLVTPPSANVPGSESSGGSPTSGPPSAPAPQCVVPRLGAKKLAAAKKALKKADCKLGRVTKLKGATAKTGLVVSQNPQTGKKLAAGAKVAVKLAPPEGA
jgi:hypothetical protein